MGFTNSPPELVVSGGVTILGGAVEVSGGSIAVAGGSLEVSGGTIGVSTLPEVTGSVGVDGIVSIAGSADTLLANYDFPADSSLLVEALNCYQAVALNVFVETQSQVTVSVVNTTHPSLGGTQLREISAASGGEFMVPMACDPGDQLEISILTSPPLESVVYAQGLTGPYIMQAASVPGSPLDVVSYGGLSRVTAVYADADEHTILGTPIVGTVYRLHAFTATSQPNLAVLGGVSSGIPYAAILVNNGPSSLVPGQLITEALQVQATGATGDWRASITYDTVLIPTIS